MSKNIANSREQKIIDRARQICEYEPELDFNYENGMIEIRDYSEDAGEAFFRENACRADEIDVEKLIDLLINNGFYQVGMVDAVDWKPDPAPMTLERARELLNNVINHIAAAENTNETITQLINLGFTKEELLEFNFSEGDVDYAFAEYDSDPETDD